MKVVELTNEYLFNLYNFFFKKKDSHIKLTWLTTFKYSQIRMRQDEQSKITTGLPLGMGTAQPSTDDTNLMIPNWIFMIVGWKAGKTTPRKVIGPIISIPMLK